METANTALVRFQRLPINHFTDAVVRLRLRNLDGDTQQVDQLGFLLLSLGALTTLTLKTRTSLRLVVFIIKIIFNCFVFETFNIF